MRNTDIRDFAHKKGVKLWQIAEGVGTSDTQFSKKLRRELSAKEKERIIAIIDNIAAEHATEQEEEGGFNG